MGVPNRFAPVIGARPAQILAVSAGLGPSRTTKFSSPWVSGTTFIPSSPGSIWPSLGAMLTGKIRARSVPAQPPDSEARPAAEHDQPRAVLDGLGELADLERCQMVGGQASEDEHVILSQGYEVGVVDQAAIPPGGLADDLEVGVDLAGGVEAPRQVSRLPGEVRPLDIQDLQATFQDVEIGAHLVVGRNKLAALRLDLQGEPLLAGGLGDVFEPGDGDDLGPLRDLEGLDRDGLGVAVDVEFDLDRLAGEASGGDRPSDLGLILDEDGRTGDEVADGQVFLPLGGVGRADPDRDDRDLVRPQLLGGDERRDPAVRGPVAQEHDRGHSRADSVVLHGLEHHRAEIGLATVRLFQVVDFVIREVGVESIRFDFEVFRIPLDRLPRRVERLLRHGPPLLGADLVAEDHAAAGVDQEEDCAFQLRLLVDQDRRPERREQAEEDGQDSEPESDPSPGPRARSELPPIGPDRQAQDEDRDDGDEWEGVADRPQGDGHEVVLLVRGVGSAAEVLWNLLARRFSAVTSMRMRNMSQGNIS